MKLLAFAARNQKELMRDKLNFAFGIGFPIVLLLLLSLIQSNIPVTLFAIDSLAPGVAVFGLSFVSLFSGMLIAKDRTSSFMLRLGTSPMAGLDVILGYTLPLLPMSLIQVAICYCAALFLGLSPSLNLLLAVATAIPTALLYIAIGLLCGTLLTDRQVGGVCGALLTNLSAWLSGIWFDLALVGGAFEQIAELLPFVHSVKAGRYAVAGQYALIFPELLWVTAYAFALLILAAFLFARRRQI